jgi:hypothetical protein
MSQRQPEQSLEHGRRDFEALGVAEHPVSCTGDGFISAFDAETGHHIEPGSLFYINLSADADHG